ncbi:MAG: hypothetical protein M1819_004354 [Sarea resinae]|nr:MAG: hypothetical protein M1819_004354 [Sarea resinae]
MSSPSSSTKLITLTIRGKIAIITLNNPSKLNALTQPLYLLLAQHMRTAAANPETYITLLTGTGRYFSAGADTSISRPSPTEASEARLYWQHHFLSTNLAITSLFSTHPKILITALNGPAIGLSAALIAHSDFIYAAPSAFLLTPFTALGLVTEGGASRAFVQRMGAATANEALIMGKRIGVDELVRTGFVNGVFDPQESERGAQQKRGGEVSTGSDASSTFLDMVVAHVEEQLLNRDLNPDSLLLVKELIKRPEKAVMESQNVAEVLAGLERFVEGIPQREFGRLSRGERRHKL